MIQKILRLFANNNLLMAPRREMAKHLARNFIYERGNIDALYKDFATKLVRLIEVMEKKGKPVYMFSGFRSWKEQNELYAKGRTEAGNIVTNAGGGQSYHNYGLAADLIFKQYNWSPPPGWWNEFGIEAKKLGLEWGGDWEDLRDYPHVQLRPMNVKWSDLIDYFQLST